MSGFLTEQIRVTTTADGRCVPRPEDLSGAIRAWREKNNVFSCPHYFGLLLTPAACRARRANEIARCQLTAKRGRKAPPCKETRRLLRCPTCKDGAQ